MAQNCKICDIIAETGNRKLELDANSSRSSRLVAKDWGLFGKTTVNKHRALCIGRTNLTSFEEDEAQSVEWSGDSGVLHTGSLETELSNITPEEILRKFGHDQEKVEIVGTLKERHSQYWSRDKEQMLWKHTYAFALRRTSPDAISIDPIELLKSLDLSAGKPDNDVQHLPESTFVLDWADWQTGKSDGGGTPAFAARFDSALTMAESRIAELRSIGRGLQELVIIGGGDMVEGCVIYPQQSFNIDMNRREQIRFTVGAILKGLYRLAPKFKSVRVVVAPGNHGENRINGNRTTIGDNDDLLVFEMAEVALQQDESMKHVTFEIAEKELSLATDIRGWTYGITHGDVFGRGSGAVANRVFNWYKTMAANRHPVGASDVLVTHHFHHEATADWGNTLWVQNPALDGGSDYFKEALGYDAQSGMASWVVTPSRRLQDKQILK